MEAYFKSIVDESNRNAGMVSSNEPITKPLRVIKSVTTAIADFKMPPLKPKKKAKSAPNPRCGHIPTATHSTHLSGTHSTHLKSKGIIDEKKTKLSSTAPPLKVDASHGVYAAQGPRKTMQDRHKVDLKFEVDGAIYSAYSVFDGHGDDATAADYAALHLHENLKTELKSRHCDDMSSSMTSILKRAYQRTDEGLIEASASRRSGTCVLTLVLELSQVPMQWHVAWAGDSRAILVTKDVVARPKWASVDHTPTLAREYKRVRDLDGWISEGRVNGELAVTRAFGDKIKGSGPYEKYVVTGIPDCQSGVVMEEDECIVLACDGVYDVMSNEMLAKETRLAILCKPDLDVAAKRIVDRCLELRTWDNVTAMIVRF